MQPNNPLVISSGGEMKLHDALKLSSQMCWKVVRFSGLQIHAKTPAGE